MRLAGAIFVLAACSLYGAAVAYRLFMREAKLKKLLSFINSLTEEIRLTRAELPEILKRLPEGEGFLKDGSWHGTECLKDEDIRVLSSFLSALGKTDIEGQINNAKLHTEALKLRLSEATDERKRMSRLYMSLGFLGGLFAVVLIL
ncbi:MAG: hypothetical protein E7550_06020 [Ruminococcaceae bacterium]|nr:hypothetical protein [Oscillospiraceae bacterium]